MKIPLEVKEKLGVLIDEVLNIAPEFQSVLDQAKAGDITEFEAILQLMEIASSDVNLHAKLTNLAEDKFQPPLGETAITTPEPSPSLLFEKEYGLPQLNPLYQGAIMERLQFDSDIPELRSGPMPPEGRPAIPVTTTARSAVSIGADLERAEEVTIDKIDANRKRLAETLEQEFLEIRGESGALVPYDRAEQVIAKYDNANYDIPEYRRGGLPAPIRVAPHTGSELAKMSDYDRQQYTWKFLSTTHGRRSAEPVISDLILGELNSDGYVVQLTDQKTLPEPLVSSDWSIAIDGGSSTQSNFAIIDVAAKSLTRKIKNHLSDAYKGKALTMKVSAFDMYADRRVGWRVELSGGSCDI